jgi:ABC-type polysaccharide/polyol phosphate transport system ATPase subunit
MKTPLAVEIKDVTLTYDLYYDRSDTLKEYLLNLFHKRKYVDKKVGKLNALNKINLTLHQGERLGIIGHNGSGKSTLLKVISGILKPTNGQISVFGEIQPLIEISAGFNLEFSGRENIYLNGYMLGYTKKQIQEKEEEIIEFSGLSEFIDVPIKYYSSGMAMKLAFTIATSIEPEFLIFDEMLAAGDASFFNKAKKRMDDLVEKSKLVVIVSHNLDFIKTFTTRTVVIDHGEIKFDGDPTEAVEYYLKNLSI